jgi:hypothetical protein
MLAEAPAFVGHVSLRLKSGNSSAREKAASWGSRRRDPHPRLLESLRDTGGDDALPYRGRQDRALFNPRRLGVVIEAGVRERSEAPETVPPPSPHGPR